MERRLDDREEEETDTGHSTQDRDGGLMKGRQHGYGPIQWELCWLVLDMSPCFFPQTEGCMALSSRTGELVLTMKTDGDTEQK